MKKYLLFWLSFVLMIATLYLIFLYVPPEKEMGIVQKIFYFMVPLGWLSMLAFLIIFIGSIQYLRTKQSKWDVLSHASAEIGIVFTTLTLITGSLWAKPTWGVWWDWGTPRLTSTLVLWFIYLAYFLVRSFATEEYRGATFAAVVGIVGFVDIPIIVLATSLWRGMHPPMIIFKGDVAPQMMITLTVSIVAFTLFYVLLLKQRVAMKNAEIEIEMLREEHR